jgi:hypothetical protein
MVCFEIAPDGLDITEFGCIFRQPFNAEPVGAGFERKRDFVPTYRPGSGSGVMPSHER